MRLLFVVVMFMVLCGCIRSVPVYQTTPTPAASVVSPMAMAPMAIGPMAMGPRGYFMVPPPPPEDVAFVNGHGYPQEYRRAHLVRIKNRTDYYVAVRMDSRDIAMTEWGVPLPVSVIPPRSEAHLYAPLNRTDLRDGCESHHFEFDGYLPPNFDRPVARDAQEKPFCAGWDYQPVEVESLCMAGYC